MQALDRAIETYKARRDRVSGPVGRRDGAGRWYPAESERRACCDHIRAPSRAWPWSLLRHCCTAAHVANLYGVQAADVRRGAR